HLLESSQGLGATTQRNDSFSPGRTREMRSSSRNQVFDLESYFRLEKMCACPSAKAGAHNHRPLFCEGRCPTCLNRDIPRYGSSRSRGRQGSERLNSVRRVGKAAACPPFQSADQMVGTAQMRLCPPYAIRVLLSWRETQSNRIDTDSSAAVRAIASEIKPAIESVRMLGALRTASVGMIESVMTSSFSREEAMRVTAPPESTP